MDFKCAFAENSHIDYIFEIEKICFPTECWSFEAIKKDILNTNTIYVVAVADSKIVGYANASAVCGECELNRIAVLPEFRNLKIGEALLKEVAAACKAAENNIMFLEVRESNCRAIGLYKKFGFEKCGLRKNYYKNPTENAVLMSLKI